MVRFTSSTSAVSALKYLTSELSRDDLNEEILAETGRWVGKGAERLGLRGAVTHDQFACLASNVHPSGEHRLSDRSSPTRPPGLHVTIDPFKSASIMGEVLGDAAVFGAVVNAARDAMREAETRACARVRKGGADENRVTGEIVAAEYLHRVTRPVGGKPDPQIHLHYFIFNQTFDAVEGKWKALQSFSMREDAPVIEQVFQASLIRRLRDLGYEVERRGESWEIAGFSRKVVERFSNRSDQIGKEASARGVTDPHELDGLGVRTREPKSPARAYSDLRAEWTSRLSPEEHAKLEAVKVQAQEKTNRAEAIRVPDRGEPWAEKPERERVQGAREQDRDERARADTKETKSRAEEANSNGDDAHRESSTWGHAEPRRTVKLSPADQKKLDEAIRHAVGVVFERAASVPEKVLLDAGFKLGLGSLHIEDIRESLARHGVETRILDGRRTCTTHEAIAEEAELVKVATGGKGRYVTKSTDEIGPLNNLTAEQRQAVYEVLSSPDVVTMIRGGAGSGKTRLTGEAVREAWKQIGCPVCMLAPTAKASRGVLRDEGHKGADTVAKFFFNEKLQQQARGGIIWVDEAGMLASKDLKRLLTLAVDLGARVVLMGDNRQHKAVNRCGWWEVLVEYAGVRIATVDGVMRQKGAYKEVVELLGRSDFQGAVARLERMGAIRELPRDKVLREAATDYVKTVLKGESVVMVGQTHRQIREVTDHVRAQLREAGRIKGEDRTVLRLKSRFLTEFERREKQSYRPGDVVEFHRTVKTLGNGVFERKSRWEVLGHDPAGHVMVQCGMSLRALPLSKASAWDVYEESTIQIARGDRIRITKSDKVTAQSDKLVAVFMPSRRKPSHEINNGDSQVVARVSLTGKVILENGKVLPKGFGHIAHDYCVTSQAAQGGTWDRTITLMTSDSGMASNREHFNVGCTRGAKSVRVYTDSVAEMNKALERDNRVRSATAVVVDGDAVPDRKTREQERARRMQDDMRARAAAEAAAREQERVRAYAR